MVGTDVDREPGRDETLHMMVEILWRGTRCSMIPLYSKEKEKRKICACGSVR